MESSSHPLQVMVSDIALSSSTEYPSPGETVDDDRPEAPSQIKLTDQAGSHPVSIGLSGLKHPAVLINFDMEIEWQNRGAIEDLWQNAGAANNGNHSIKILDVIFDPAFKRRVANFSNCLTFFLDQLLCLIPKEDMANHIAHMPEEHQATILSFLDQQPEDRIRNSVYGGYFLQQLSNGSEVSFSVAALNCKEGRLLVFEPQIDENPSNTHSRRQVINRFEHIRRQPNPIETSYFLLAAQIDQASILKTEMMADEHWRLFSALYRRCLELVEGYGGIFGRHIKDGFFAYFLPDRNIEVNAMHVMECALAIKAEAMELSRQWKISKNWLRDIDLNIGIHHEEAYLGTLPTSSGEILTSFGEGMGVVNAISHLARNGQIWATKPVINRMSAKRYKTLRFGIMRPGGQEQQIFIRNGFAAVRDVFDVTKSYASTDPAVAYLPITQIFDLSGGDE